MLAGLLGLWREDLRALQLSCDTYAKKCGLLSR